TTGRRFLPTMKRLVACSMSRAGGPSRTGSARVPGSVETGATLGSSGRRPFVPVLFDSGVMVDVTVVTPGRGEWLTDWPGQTERRGPPERMVPTLLLRSTTTEHQKSRRPDLAHGSCVAGWRPGPPPARPREAQPPRT